MLTTSNYAVLDVRRNHPVTAGFGWGDVTDEMLQQMGVQIDHSANTQGVPVKLNLDTNKSRPAGIASSRPTMTTARPSGRTTGTARQSTGAAR